jgi:hypothetical protein
MPTISAKRQALCLGDGKASHQLQVFAQWSPANLAWVTFLGIPALPPSKWQAPPRGCRRIVNSYAQAKREIGRFN